MDTSSLGSRQESDRKVHGCSATISLIINRFESHQCLHLGAREVSGAAPLKVYPRSAEFWFAKVKKICQISKYRDMDPKKTGAKTVKTDFGVRC